MKKKILFILCCVVWCVLPVRGWGQSGPQTGPARPRGSRPTRVLNNDDIYFGSPDLAKKSAGRIGYYQNLDAGYAFMYPVTAETVVLKGADFAWHVSETGLLVVSFSMPLGEAQPQTVNQTTTGNWLPSDSQTPSGPDLTSYRLNNAIAKFRSVLDPKIFQVGKREFRGSFRNTERYRVRVHVTLAMNGKPVSLDGVLLVIASDKGMCGVAALAPVDSIKTNPKAIDDVLDSVTTL